MHACVTVNMAGVKNFAAVINNGTVGMTSSCAAFLVIGQWKEKEKERDFYAMSTFDMSES
jgi:hypothetical protein